MEFGPILRSIRRSKMRFALIVLQIAVTLAVVTNCINMIIDERTQMNKQSGFDDDNIVNVRSVPFDPAFNDTVYARHSIDADLRTIAAIPGVRAVANTPFLQWQGGGSSTTFRPGGKPQTVLRAQFYNSTPGMLDTLGVKIIAGRALTQEDVDAGKNGAPVCVISQKMAELFFPGENAVGKQLIEDDGSADTIVGVFNTFYNPYPWPIDEYGILYPGRTGTFASGMPYLVRVEPGAMKRVVPEIEKRLIAANNGRNIQTQTITEVRDGFFSNGRLVVATMSTVIVLIVIVTGLGIVGVTAFTVNERKKQIGTRRALGATRRDILRYFLLENWIVTNSGLILGVVAAYALNYLLVTKISGAKLDWRFVGVGIALLWLQGLGATFVPALRAARLSPVIATRGA